MQRCHRHRHGPQRRILLAFRPSIRRSHRRQRRPRPLAHPREVESMPYGEGGRSGRETFCRVQAQPRRPSDRPQPYRTMRNLRLQPNRSMTLSSRELLLISSARPCLRLSLPIHYHPIQQGYRSRSIHLHHLPLHAYASLTQPHRPSHHFPSRPSRNSTALIPRLPVHRADFEVPP